MIVEHKESGERFLVVDRYTDDTGKRFYLFAGKKGEFFEEEVQALITHFRRLST